MSRPRNVNWSDISLVFLGIGLTLFPGRGAAQQRLVVSGDRLQSVVRRVASTEADQLTLRTRLPMEPFAAERVRCVRIPRGLPASSPVLLSDGSTLVATYTPHALLWVTGNAITRQVDVGHRLVGNPAEGAAGRVVVLDDTNVLRSYAPDGAVRETVTFAGRARSGALALNDGSIAVALDQGVGGEIAVVSQDFTQVSSLSVAGRIDRALSRGADGSILFNTNLSVVSLNSDRAGLVTYSWARNVLDGWLLEDQLLAVLVGSPPTGEVRLSTPQGSVRSVLPAREAYYPTARGHLVLSRGLIPDPSATATAATSTNGAAGTTGTTATTGTTGATGATATTAATPVAPRIQAALRPRPRVGRYGFGYGVTEAPVNTHTEFLLYDSRGRQVSSAVIPLVSVVAVMLDPDDTMLVLTPDGHAIAIDPGGVLRWNVDLHLTLGRAPVALPEGGWVMSVGGAAPGVCTVTY